MADEDLIVLLRNMKDPKVQLEQGLTFSQLEDLCQLSELIDLSQFVTIHSQL